MIQAQALHKSFCKKGKSGKSVVAVKDVSFHAEDGMITGLLGANGAGKSTTLRILSGLVTPDSGCAQIDQWNIQQHPIEVRKHIGYLPHNSGIYPRLTARENILYFAQLAGLSKLEANKRTDELIELLNMEEIAQRRTEGFSQGQRTKVALARTLVHNPKNLILDEPTNGLDVISTRKLRAILSRLRDLGHCILISSHIMQEVSLLCGHIAIINAGKVVLEGNINEILHTTGQTDFEEAFVVAIGESVEDSEC